MLYAVRFFLLAKKRTNNEKENKYKNNEKENKYKKGNKKCYLYT